VPIDTLSLALASLLCGQTVDMNLDLARGNLSGWEGQGFFLVSADTGTGAAFGLSSEDARSVAGKGMIRHVFVPPSGAGRISFHARAVRPHKATANDKLDVLLMARGRRVIAKSVRSARDWAAAGAPENQLLEYSWDVSKLAGQTLQIVLLDDDDRPGHYLTCTAFRILPAHDPLIEKFAREMMVLQEKHQLHSMFRYDSKRFTALSNAGEAFSVNCLRNCERLHDLFYDHFIRKGFKLQQPEGRLMLAVFDSQDGFEAYLARKMSSNITGVYHPASNRLVVYDLIRNNALMAHKDKALKEGANIRSEFKRTTFVETIERQARDHSNDVGLGTIMHETAHQLSFNSGLLERTGDVAVWLAEGLACYCEATEDGSWRGIGEVNPQRLGDLHAALKRGSRLLLPEELVRDDEWRNNSKKVLLGYSQSWALFHMLMTEQPAKMREYLELIKSRRSSDYRLLDFCQVFGSNMRQLEQRQLNHVQTLLARNPPQARR